MGYKVSLGEGNTDYILLKLLWHAFIYFVWREGEILFCTVKRIPSKKERVRNSIESSVRRRLMGTKKLRQEVRTESQKRLLVSRGIIELREF